MAIYLFYKLMGWNILWGNPTLVILISFLGGIQLISVGILGEYIGRIYDEVRERPKFIVESAEGFDQQSLTSGETEPTRPIARE
jgi:dolichol-phosphate mannosyltransferase